MDMLLLSPLAVLAAPWAPWSMAALLVAAVPPLSWQWRGRGFVLSIRLLQDRWRAQLRRFAEGLGGLVVPWGWDLADLAAAVQPWRGSDAHDGPKGGDGDLVLKRARIALWPVRTLWWCQRAISRSQCWGLVVFTVFLLLLLLLLFVLLLLILFIIIILLDCWPPVTLFALLPTVVVASSVVVALQEGGRRELVEVLSGSQRASCEETNMQNKRTDLIVLTWHSSVSICPSFTCVEWTGGAGGGGAALARASRFLAAMTVTVRAQLLWLSLAVLAAVVTGGDLHQHTVKSVLFNLLCKVNRLF